MKSMGQATLRARDKAYRDQRKAEMMAMRAKMIKETT